MFTWVREAVAKVGHEVGHRRHGRQEDRKSSSLPLKIYFLILALNSMLRVWLSFANTSSH